MRLYPSIPLLSRQAITSVSLGEIILPSPDIFMVELVVSSYVIHRNSELYNRPNEFLPQRWLGTEMFQGVPPPKRDTFIPFGLGARSCIGMQVVMLEAKEFLGQLTNAFKLNLNKRSVFEPKMKISLRPQSVWIEFEDICDE
jgi:pentalenene oxygenase